KAAQHAARTRLACARARGLPRVAIRKTRCVMRGASDISEISVKLRTHPSPRPSPRYGERERDGRLIWLGRTPPRSMLLGSPVPSVWTRAYWFRCAFPTSSLSPQRGEGRGEG